MTLVQKAKTIKSSGLNITGRKSQHRLTERVDLALAYCRGEISLEQAGKALGTSPAQSMGSALMTAARAGLIRIKKVEAA